VARRGCASNSACELVYACKVPWVRSIRAGRGLVFNGHTCVPTLFVCLDLTANTASTHTSTQVPVCLTHQYSSIGLVLGMRAAEVEDPLAQALALAQQLMRLLAEAVSLAQIQRPEVSEERLVQLRRRSAVCSQKCVGEHNRQANRCDRT